jgi:putative FmdB family regulatory protein
MPTYVYECDHCHDTFELIQKFDDKPLKKCKKCGKHKLYKVPQVPMSASVKKTASDWKTLGDLAAHNREKMTDAEYKEQSQKEAWKQGYDRTLANMTPRQQKDYIERGVKPTPSSQHSLGMAGLTGKRKVEKKEKRKKR